MKHLFLGIVILLLIFPTVSAYNASFNVSPIAMSLMTATATNTTRGLNISVVKTGTLGTTLAAALTGTTLALGVTKVATVGRQQNCSNISTISRGAITFPVQLPSNATIINASLILYLSSKTVTFGTPDLYVTSYSPSDMTNQVANDYKQFKDTDTFYNATPIQFATWTAATRKVIVLNDAARTAINNSNRINNEGNFTIGLKVNWDLEANNRTMIWTPLTAQSALYTIGGKDAVDHKQDPKLNITYSMPDHVGYAEPIADFAVNLTPGISGTTAQFFSLSNNTQGSSTKYSWNFTDGGVHEDSDIMNPTFVYTTAGTYTVRLRVTNPGPISNTTTKTNYIYVYDAPTPTPCPGECDNYTTSLLHYEGADHSTDIIDDNTANTWLLRNVGEITTAEQKFGVSSYGTTDASSYAELTPPSATAFDLEALNWTWDTWIMYDDNLLATPHGIFTMGAQGAGSKSIILDLENIAGVSSYNLNIYNGIVTTGSYQYEPLAGEYNTAQWYHLELTRNMSNMYLFIDGDLKTWDHISGGLSDSTNLGNPGNITLGYDSKSGHYLDGWLDETRMSVGEHRHIADFTPETAAYTYDPCPTCAPGGGCSLSPGNFSQVANFSGYGMIIFQNKTYDVYDQNYTPLPVYLLIAGIGLLFLIISFIVQKNAEIFAAIAIIPLAAASWSSLSIDMVQSFGLSALANVSMQSVWILLENHVIYPNVALAIIFLILTVVAFIQFIHELLQGRSIENTPEEPDEN